jgi:hypothetical protein
VLEADLRARRSCIGMRGEDGPDLQIVPAVVIARGCQRNTSFEIRRLASLAMGRPPLPVGSFGRIDFHRWRSAGSAGR